MQTQEDSSENAVRGRILYCHPGVELYGSDRMAVATVKGLRERNWEVTVVLPQRGPLADLFKDAGSTVITHDFPVLRKSMLRPTSLIRLMASTPAVLRMMRGLIKKSSADIVYVNTITQPGWLLAARTLRIPSAIHVREAEESLPIFVQRLLLAPLALSTIAIANSRATARHVVKLGVFMKGKTEVVYNGKDWGPYFRSEYRGPQTPATILFVGRLNPRKGPDLIIRALRIIIDAGVPARLVVAGSVFPGYEWYETELRALTKEAGLIDSVDFVGFKEDTAELFEKADLAVVPSRAEPFGTVAAESMAAMRPTVVSDVQGLVEIVSDESIGRVFGNEDYEALAARCIEILRDPALAKQIAKAGRDSVKRRFSLDAYNSSVHRTMSALIKGVGR